MVVLLSIQPDLQHAFTVQHALVSGYFGKSLLFSSVALLLLQSDQTTDVAVFCPSLNYPGARYTMAGFPLR
jgi:hypothetical protein